MTETNMASIAPLLLSAREASKALGISQRTLWGLKQRGLIGCVQIGRRTLYDPRDLSRFIDARKREGAA